MLVLATVTLALGTAACHTSEGCPVDHLCIRGGCKRVIAKAATLAARRNGNGTHGTLPARCFNHTYDPATAAPNAGPCVAWRVDAAAHERVCESNGVPPYYVPPYCPFGAGQGYCRSPTQGNSTDCPPFAGKVCPCVPGVAPTDDDEAGGTGGCPSGTTAVGDVLVPVYQLFRFPLDPDPTRPDRPLHMYNNTALSTGNSYQVIGAHLNGVQLKGPAEANGFNVDTSLIPLPCGGHVTPPVGPGPVYHYHKAADCQRIETAGQHGPLVGYAADGFAIYGFGDFRGSPVLDECHGHFGATSGAPGAAVTYHYHAADAYNTPGSPHKPYYLGCLGPSVGRCNETVAAQYDGGANWCGEGCGFDVCVQPGTGKAALAAYLDAHPGSAKWLDGFSVNPY